MKWLLLRREIWSVCGAVCGLAAVGGCVKKSALPMVKSAAPRPTPTPLAFSIAVSDLSPTLFDEKGNIIAKVQAKGAQVGPGNGADASNPIGAVQAASATLYQKGKPAATFHADHLKGDRDSRTLIGTGNVTLSSLTQPDSPTIRADTMTWKYGENSVTGNGNVLITRKPDMRLPGKFFRADTAIRTFSIQGGGDSAPTSGGF